MTKGLKMLLIEFIGRDESIRTMAEIFEVLDDYNRCHQRLIKREVAGLPYVEQFVHHNDQYYAELIELLKRHNYDFDAFDLVPH